MATSADLVQAKWDLRRAGLDEVGTMAAALAWLPGHIAAEFTCPGRGPHEWTSANIPNVCYQWCKHCPAKKRIVRG